MPSHLRHGDSGYGTRAGNYSSDTKNKTKNLKQKIQQNETSRKISAFFLYNLSVCFCQFSQLCYADGRPTLASTGKPCCIEA